MPQLSFNTPLGAITLTEESDSIISLDWGWSSFQEITPFLIDCQNQINDYFDGAIKGFNFPVTLSGTKFQTQVWQLIAKIPYGQTMTYGEIAKVLSTSPRSVGQACGRNVIPIIIPCHRVTGLSNHGLGSYTGPNGQNDLDSKEYLLNLERRHI